VDGSGFEFSLEGDEVLGKDGTWPLLDFLTKRFEIHCHIWALDYQQRQTRLPISQRLKICSTSDSEESGNLSFFVG
jgi:hypothetical protein